MKKGNLVQQLILIVAVVTSLGAYLLLAYLGLGR